MMTARTSTKKAQTREDVSRGLIGMTKGSVACRPPKSWELLVRRFKGAFRVNFEHLEVWTSAITSVGGLKACRTFGFSMYALVIGKLRESSVLFGHRMVGKSYDTCFESVGGYTLML